MVTNDTSSVSEGSKCEDGEPIHETVGALSKRLRKEGRLEEYRAARAEAIAKNPGMSTFDASCAVYDRFLPLDGKKTVHAGASYSVLGKGLTKDELARLKADKSMRRAKRQGVLDKKVAARKLELIKSSPDVDIGMDEMVSWVGSNIAAPDEAVLGMDPPSKATWSLYLWAKDNVDAFWKMFQGAKKKAGAGSEDSARRMDLEQTLRTVYEAAKVSVLDAAELDRDTFGLPDLVAARETILKAERGESDFEGEE
jgi:hypothetical protein